MSLDVVHQMGDITLDVWGDFAMFTQPDSKVERVSYPIPTPSSLRGILDAIYAKPIEFYYQITGYDIMNEIRTVSIKKNETKDKVDSKNPKPIYQIAVKGDHGLTQRSNIYLKNVYYRIYAKIIRRKDFSNRDITALVTQFNKRAEKGKCFFQPCLGTRECICYFSLPDMSKKPLDINRNFGITLYDVFDIRDNTPLNTDPNKLSGNTNITFFNAESIHGHINVPLYDSNDIYRRA